VTRTRHPTLPRAAASAALAVCAALLAGVAPPPLAAQDLLHQARAAAERGSIDTAYTLLQRAVEAEPDRAEAHFWLGQVAGTRAAQHRSLGSYFLARRAKRAFGRAVQLEPGNPAYLEGLGRFLAMAPGIVGGDRDSARALGERLLSIDPMRGTFLLVQLHARSTPAGRARADSLVEAFAAHPSGGREGQVRLGVYFVRGRPDRALPIGERLVAADSADALGHLVLGSALVALRRDPAAAARHLHYALDHPPPVTTDGRQYWPPILWYMLGQAHLQLGQPDSARAALERALRLSPGFRPAKQALDSLARSE
jgi:tetratricopeptide (TPR) repeat protein